MAEVAGSDDEEFFDDEGMNLEELDDRAAKTARTKEQTEHEAFVQTLRTRQRVEFAMAILEDFPELVINIVFATSQGNQLDAEPLSTADISLLIFGAVLSLYHIGKCIMTYVKFRAILKEADAMTADQALACVESDAKVKYGHRHEE